MTAAEVLIHHHNSSDPSAMRDPVCGMIVDPATAKHRAEHAGHSYFFCSAKCRDKFTAEPARYLASPPAGAPGARPPAKAGEVLWTCPMHPQIVRNAPGGTVNLSQA